MVYQTVIRRSHSYQQKRQHVIDLTTPPPVQFIRPGMVLVNEDVVLQPKDTTITDTDQWPSYAMRQVNIVLQGTSERVSLLEAHAGQPVKVSGKLETIPPEQQHQGTRNHILHDLEQATNFLSEVKDAQYRTVTVELENVTTYAFAEYDDGSYGFWAEGKAGWFEVKTPAGPYQRKFHEMSEAASMFYVLADKVKRARKDFSKVDVKGLEKFAAALFKDYLSFDNNHVRRTDVNDIRKGFHEHRKFLMTSMLEGQELASSWQGTAMLCYYKHHFPKEFAEVDLRIRAAKGEGSTTEGQTYTTMSKSSKSKAKPPKVPQTQVEPELVISDNTTEDDEYEKSHNSKVSGHKRKSILQPAGSKYSKKAAGRRVSSVQIDEAQDEQMDDDEAWLSATATNQAGAERLRSSFQPIETTPYHEYLPRKYAEVKVVEHELPTLVPQGPGDVWTCTFEGCRKRVYEGSTMEGRSNIQEHFEAHARGAQEKIDLVLKESRPYLPVDNLVRRLQSFSSITQHETMSTKAAAADPSKKFPAPITRRY